MIEWAGNFSHFWLKTSESSVEQPSCKQLFGKHSMGQLHFNGEVYKGKLMCMDTCMFEYQVSCLNFNEQLPYKNRVYRFQINLRYIELQTGGFFSL